jgi:hypothetical protein
MCVKKSPSTFLQYV